MDSPAELLNDPWGTLRAGSILPSFWSGLSAIEGLVLSELSRPFKLREFFALLKKLAAFVTVLLRRFFSAAGP
jgi:hypothetical protein